MRSVLFGQRQKANEMRITIYSGAFQDIADQAKRDSRIRIVAFLRDDYGTTYNAFYRTRDTNFPSTLEEDYETVLLPCQSHARFNETFFIKLPTGDLSSLSELYLMFLYQVLPPRSKKKKKGEQGEEPKFETVAFSVMPLFDSRRGTLIENKLHSLFAL